MTYTAAVHRVFNLSIKSPKSDLKSLFCNLFSLPKREFNLLEHKNPRTILKHQIKAERVAFLLGGVFEGINTLESNHPPLECNQHISCKSVEPIFPNGCF